MVFLRGGFKSGAAPFFILKKDTTHVQLLLYPMYDSAAGYGFKRLYHLTGIQPHPKRTGKVHFHAPPERGDGKGKQRCNACP